MPFQPSFSATLTLEEYQRLTREETAEIIASEYADTDGADPWEMEYGTQSDCS